MGQKGEDVGTLKMAGLPLLCHQLTVWPWTDRARFHDGQMRRDRGSKEKKQIWVSVFCLRQCIRCLVRWCFTSLFVKTQVCSSFSPLLTLEFNYFCAELRMWKLNLHTTWTFYKIVLRPLFRFFKHSILPFYSCCYKWRIPMRKEDLSLNLFTSFLRE